ncbi:MULTISPECIES: hypothetical protein [unclassified Roseobacter]|uniref:hypothetical protein n=2 Tax=unclassified Roseobacter TaxID=196798 RepID=UPI001492CB26|nr:MULTISPECIES: hypothetical protein [unclassified Roseobacter]NNV32133.1 hypothetical protein [Roseobacter sp. HKCCD9061]NNX32345.1 hypothetical protein [Roseobacter sp. HKCCD6503]NOB07046.1 hypothetical protein [Roseobacter sp. HKCCD8721]NOD19758.1 hypothetical protein [Roseobacter sp. HKCCD7580]
MMYKTTNLHRVALVVGMTIAVMVPSIASATTAGSSGIDASFETMRTDLNTMLSGNFGSLMLLVSLIIGIAIYAFTSSMKWVISSVLIAFLIGYGIDIISGIGGVTATVDMLAATTEMPADSLDSLDPL